MTENFESATLVSSLSNMNPRREYNHLLTVISQKVTKKMCVLAIFNILVGAVLIGLDIGLFLKDELT